MAGGIEDGGRVFDPNEDGLGATTPVPPCPFLHMLAWPVLAQQFLSRSSNSSSVPRHPSMASSPLRNMPALAAAATECRIYETAGIKREAGPTKNCSVCIHGELVVSYQLRRVGGPKHPTVLHSEAPRRFEQSFDLYDPDTIFGSYTACRDAIHGMLAQIPLLREFDLGADNWDDFFTPGIVAKLVVDGFRRDTDQHGGVALGISLGLRWAVTVRVVYSEPQAVLLACTQPRRVRFETSGCGRFMRMMPTGAAPEFMTTTVPPTECCVCMEDLAAQGSAYTVRLPCSHSFHRGCILPWFYKVATCPMCRRDMAKMA